MDFKDTFKANTDEENFIMDIFNVEIGQVGCSPYESIAYFIALKIRFMAFIMPNQLKIAVNYFDSTIE